MVFLGISKSPSPQNTKRRWPSLVCTALLLDGNLWKYGRRHHGSIHRQLFGLRWYLWVMPHKFGVSSGIVRRYLSGPQLGNMSFHGEIYGCHYLETTPSTPMKAIKSFLGHTRFYRRLVKNFSSFAWPLIKVLEKDVPFEFNEECMTVFLTLKQKIMEHWS